MNEIETASLMIKGMLTEESPEVQAKVVQCRTKLTEAIKEDGEEGQIALLLEGLEVMKEILK